jgi:hypothetical protein
MSTWYEYFWGTSTPSTTTPTNNYNNSQQQNGEFIPPQPLVSKPQDIENLPEYNTFNSLAPEFQLTPDNDPDHIFPREYELIEEIRRQIPAVSKWPDRYILIFLFARRHSISHTVNLLNKHLAYLEAMGFPEISEDNLYPFTPDQLTEEEFRLSLMEGPLAYKHISVDKHNRILQIVRPRYWVYGRISMKKYVSFVFWWYYYSWQHVPLSLHRNGMAVIIDMTNMGWSNLDFSVDVQNFISSALSCFPGRMRQAWLVNSGWILSSALTLLAYVLSEKVMSRMVTVTQEGLFEKVDKQYIPVDLGGTWLPDFKKDWYEKVLELDALKKIQKK